MKDTALFPVLHWLDAGAPGTGARNAGLKTELHHRRAQSNAARLALRESARRSGLTEGHVFTWDPQGAPLAQGDVHFSLSHTSNPSPTSSSDATQFPPLNDHPFHALAAAVVAPFPVGIDVEALRPCHPKLAQRLILPEDKALFGAASDDLLIRLWSAKEAALKAATVGLRKLRSLKTVRMAHFSDDISQITFELEDHRWCVVQKKQADVWISLALPATFQHVPVYFSVSEDTFHHQNAVSP